MEVDELLKKLRDYYKTNCKQLVFVNEKRLSTNNKCRMYFLDVLEEQEAKNYKKLFQEYLVSYIRNRDSLSVCRSIACANNDEELSVALLSEGKKVRNSGAYPDTEINSAGIYGELFDDFYLNIVKDEPILMAYFVRSSFNIANPRGFDLVATKIDGDVLTIILSEAKFVQNIYKAKDALCNDIAGSQTQDAHVSKEYINEYVSSFMNKDHSLYFDNLDSINKIRSKLNELNDLLLNENLNAIDAINRLGIRVRFDFFAIYHDNNHNIEERKQYFDDISNQFNANINETGILNYDTEIVFIPTKNTSVDLKGMMEQWD